MSCGTRAKDSSPGDPDGAGSSVLFSVINYLPVGVLRTTGTALLRTAGVRTAQWPVTAPLFGSRPRCPSCVCSGLEPHCRTSRCARPQPTPSPRYRSVTSLLGTADCTHGHRNCHDSGPAPAAPHCGPPGPAVSPVAVLQQSWLRNSTAAPPCNYMYYRQFVSARSCCLSGLREKP